VRETCIFTPANGFAPLTDVVEVTDPTVFKRDDRWWMCVGTEVRGREAIQLGTASLPPGAPLSATGWTLTADAREPHRIAVLPQQRSLAWDRKGGRHCPSYVKGRDPHANRDIERIYYAGGAENVWGPYTIGFLEWDGESWVDQSEPAFVATEPWERGSVFEPNVVYADGRWRLWYVAGSNHEDYLVQGYAESDDGRTNWSPHAIFAPPEMKMFDFRPLAVAGGYEAVFARVALRGAPPPETGLWWCRCDWPSPHLAAWGEPVQIMTAADRGWHAGPWKPSIAYDAGAAPEALFVFFSGAYSRNDGSAFPFAFTLGCASGVCAGRGVPSSWPAP
jgi:hypothetical protein